jgi:hypothetical protein
VGLKAIVWDAIAWIHLAKDKEICKGGTVQICGNNLNETKFYAGRRAD